MTRREQLSRDLDALDEDQLAEVADFVTFLALKRRVAAIEPANRESLAALYAKFEAEDVALAEAGIDDFRRGLEAEDGA